MVDDEFAVWERLQEELFHLSDLLRGDKPVEGVDEITFTVMSPAA